MDEKNNPKNIHGGEILGVALVWGLSRTRINDGQPASLAAVALPHPVSLQLLYRTMCVDLS